MLKRFVRSEIEQIIGLALVGTVLALAWSAIGRLTLHRAPWSSLFALLESAALALVVLFWGLSMLRIRYWAWRKRASFLDMWEAVRLYQFNKAYRPFRKVTTAQFEQALHDRRNKQKFGRIVLRPK